MKKTISEWEFISDFQDSSRKDNFSENGLSVIYEILSEWEDSTDEEFELDIIAICCQFTEFSIDELLSDYKDIQEYVNDEIESLKESDDFSDEDIDYKQLVEDALDDIGAFYRWIDDDSLILDVESF